MDKLVGRTRDEGTYRNESLLDIHNSEARDEENQITPDRCNGYPPKEIDIKDIPPILNAIPRRALAPMPALFMRTAT